ncbi:hypothetical protein V8G54_020593 [Vigna mungo]|uniref:Uncharacterized protein n=1 Tax=Vigna mungo TaxID=3915 RepID=A0AAQ3RUV2_VIGMU
MKTFSTRGLHFTPCSSDTCCSSGCCSTSRVVVVVAASASMLSPSIALLPIEGSTSSTSFCCTGSEYESLKEVKRLELDTASDCVERRTNNHDNMNNNVVIAKKKHKAFLETTLMAEAGMVLSTIVKTAFQEITVGSKVKFDV